jgi:hypothetical protein
MTDHRNRKKKLIISYKNLSEELRELFKEAYPDGYKDYLQKTIKPNGDPIFVVPLETDDTSYMIKFDVKIDTGLVEEDLDKDLYEGDDQEEPEFAPLSEAIEKEEGSGHSVGKLKHGAYEEMFEGLPEDKKEFEMANEDMESEFADLADDTDDDDDDERDEDIEPDDDELLDIEALLDEADSGEGLLREDNPPEEKHAKKKESRAVKAVKAVGADVRKAKQSKSADKPKAETKTTKTATVKKATKTTTAKATSTKTSTKKK